MNLNNQPVNRLPHFGRRVSAAVLPQSTGPKVDTQSPKFSGKPEHWENPSARLRSRAKFNCC